MDSTPGAGPSRPRQEASTPSATPAPLSTPKSRRRSWFPFGSSSSTAPAPSADSMPPPPLPLMSSKSGKSKTKSKAGLEGEEVELGFVTPRQSMDLARTPSNAAREEEELLTIDGQVDQEAKDMTVRKKKKRRSKGEEEEGETMRMTDFKPTRRTSTASDASSRTEMPSGNQRSFSERKFSRTASDRAAFPDVTSEGFVKPPPRVSSIPLHPPAKVARVPSNSSNKDQPPIPVDRPLPPLPPEPTSKPPIAPTGIVVTPSSPRKDRHDQAYQRDAYSLGAASDNMRINRRSRSSESQRTRSRERTVRKSPIGLGLPEQLLPRDDDHPPPLPSKKQSVSTPVPTRTPSPIPRIAFIEPDQVLDERGRTATITDKRQRVKRARSLSGIFKSSPVVTSVTPTSSRPTTPDPKETEEAGGGGILEWLGMKKTVKRRQSETHLRRHKPDSTTPPQPDVPRMPSPVPRLSHDSRSAKSPHGSYVDLVSRHSQDSTSRPSSRSAAAPPSAGTSPSKLGSLFSRRQASKRTESSGVPSPPTSLPAKTSGGNRDSGAASARSSFSLPPFDPAVSPIYPNFGPWMSSPGTDMEEMLTSPDGGLHWGPGIRPWMDATEQAQRSPRSSISSPPPSSLPERGVQEAGPTAAKPVTEGRGRSHSDAPPPSAVRIQDPHPTNRHHSPDSLGPRMAMSLQSSPATPGRPKLGNRANSGNAAIIDRMKTVFARNSTRQRASTLLPERTVQVDEFGSLRSSHEWPSNSSSASFGSPRAPDSGGRVSIDEHAHGSLLGLQDAERRKMSHEAGSNRSSIAASIASQATSASARAVPSQEMRKEGSFISRARPRASTMSSGPTTQAFAPPSPMIFPAAATPPRRRPSAIRKLSNTLLGASSRPSSPKSGSLFPLPPRSSGSVTSVISTSGLAGEGDLLGPAMSSRPSLGSISAAATSSQNLKQVAKRDGDESPEQYIERISQVIPRNEIAGALATSADTFHAEALKCYMTRFDLKNLPLDVALRRLLMHMSLPKETQQIDRVMEAFAARYEECESDLFQQKDNTYVLAFSMMMLHTDAFNKHNKNKMSKSDYVRNTRLDGVSPLVLEAFFDNITFTPFVFIEDDADLLPSSAADSTTPSTGVSTPGSMPPPKSSRIDVYHMIVNHQLASLHVDVERHIPSENPYSAFGTIDNIALDALHQTFTRAQLLQVTMPGRRKTSTGILSSTPTRGAPPVEITLKVVKVGTLSRVDETHDTGKKANRKWKTWSVVLTGTQLLFLKDSLWATLLQERARRAASQGLGSEADQAILLPPTSTFKPDEVFPLRDCVAVYDRSSPTRSNSNFRLVMPQHRQYLFSASDQQEMNDWVSLINYAAAFKTAGMRMRGVAMNKDQAVLAGAAAAASHKREVQGAAIMTGTPAQPTSIKGSRAQTTSELTTPKKAIFGDASARSHADVSPVTPKSDSLKVDTGGGGKASSVDVDAADDVVVDEGEQLEEVFDVVKAELAAGRGGATRKSTVQPYSDGPDNAPVSHSAQSGRAAAFLTQIERCTTKRHLISGQLDSYLTTARNLAILTPFQRSTRDRLAAALPSLAERIKADRIQLVKYDMWIHILRQDLDKDKQEWARVRHVALQAAAKSLKDPKGVKAVVDDVNDDPSTTLPRLSLPDSTESASSSSPPISPLDGLGVGSGSPGEFPVVIRRPSDDIPRQTDGHRPRHRDRDRDRDRERTVRPTSSNASRPKLQRSSSSLLSAQGGETEPSPTTGRSTPLMFNLSESEDQDQTEPHPKQGERAEDWQKTRAAKRVSLASVDLPDGEMRRLSLKKRDREVTAVYIGKGGDER